MIKIFKFFAITIIISVFIVWLSNYPGNVEIIWKEYLIHTNLIGLVSILLIFTGIVLVFYISTKKIKEIPKNYEIKKKEKYLVLGNDVLDDMAVNLVLGDSVKLEKNSRMLKKFLRNDLFSTFMLFNSSLIGNKIDESKKYLKVLQGIPKADYIVKRAIVLVNLKENKFDEAKDNLNKFCEDYPNDQWFAEKLATIYSMKKDWIEAHNILLKLKIHKSAKIKNMLANLKIFSGKEAPEALKISNQSINVVIETIKYYIDQSNIKKAANVFEKNWVNLLCLDIVEIFMSYKKKNESESLKRFNLISKTLKKNAKDSDESKIALALAAYESSMWGEAQKYLDSIPKTNWDKRVIDLYEKISDETPKIKLPEISENLKMEPLWSCNNCNSKFEKWDFVCIKCSAVNMIEWPKSKITVDEKDTFFKSFLENPFSHFPKMKREN